MKLYEDIVLSVFDMISYTIVSKRLLNKKIKKIIQLASILSFSFVIGTESHYIEGWPSILLSGFLIILMLYTLYRQRLKELINLYLISTILILAIQFISLVPLNALFGKIIYNFKIGIIAQAINVIFILVIVGLIPIHYIYNFVMSKNKIFNYLIVNSFLLMLFLLIYWNININGILENLISIITLSLSIIFINFIILKNSLKNEYVINKLKVNEQYLPIIDELITEIKTRQHDFKNHIQALSMMIYTSEDKSEMIAGFEKYIGEIAYKDDLNEFLKYSNKVISGFLFSKNSQAKTMGILFSITIKESLFKSKLYDYEWIEILGILIDNAMETKIWGYGLYNLEKIVSKNQGTIEVFNETRTENYIVFKVLVP